MSQEATFALTLGGITFALTVIWGGPFVEILKRLGIAHPIALEQPARIGPPTMGGLMIVVPIVIITATLNVVSLVRAVIGRSILAPVFVLIAFGLLGALDDWEELRGGRRGAGRFTRFQFWWQIAIALAVVLFLYRGFGLRSVAIPSVPLKIEIGLLYVPIATFVIVATTNAVNVTDGLDGLAGLLAATAFVAYGVIALLQGQVFLVRFCFTVVGAIFAFLWFNVHPAGLFLGRTGSLALGATLAVVALMTGQWLLLPVVAIVPVAETLSVIAQNAYSKWSGAQAGRLFEMSPLHSHFRALGWSEAQVVQRFWLVALLATMVGIALALL